MAKVTKPAKPIPRKAVGKAPPAPPRVNGGAKPATVAAPAANAPTLSAPPPAPGAQPSLKILGQYMKDFSFENPNAPQSLAPQTQQIGRAHV